MLVMDARVLPSADAPDPNAAVRGGGGRARRSARSDYPNGSPRFHPSGSFLVERLLRGSERVYGPAKAARTTQGRR